MLLSGAPLQSLPGQGDSPSFGGNPDLRTYPSTLNIKFGGTISNSSMGTPIPPIAWPSSSTRLDGTLVITDAARPGYNLTVRLPLAFRHTHGPECKTVGNKQYCSCPGDSGGPSTCYSYFALSGFCIGVNASTGRPIPFPGTLSVGCAPLPRIPFLTGAEAIVSVPQLDACVALSVDGMSPGQYRFLSYRRPSEVMRDAVPMPVFLRSAADPWIVGMGLTDGTADFGYSEAYLRGVSIAMAVCLSLSAAAVFCLCCAPPKACFCCVEVQDEEKPLLCPRSMASVCADMDALTGLAIAAVAITTFACWLGFLIVGSIAAGPQAKQACAEQQLCAGGPTIGIGCGTLPTMLSLGGPAQKLLALEISGASHVHLHGTMHLNHALNHSVPRAFGHGNSLQSPHAGLMQLR